VNYRRFFDINELVAIRMEDEAVFRRAHQVALPIVPPLFRHRFTALTVGGNVDKEKPEILFRTRACATVAVQ
jgi:hypothetical protein